MEDVPRGRSDFGTPAPDALTGLAKEMHEAFSPEGLLAKSPDFEYRAEQQRMAVEVGQALEKKRPVIIEAGTGVGKSLAYLLPAILTATRHQRKAVISTHTINLQEQLIAKDIPIVQKLVGTPFSAVLLKGRGIIFARSGSPGQCAPPGTFSAPPSMTNCGRSGNGNRKPRTAP